jgi:hypothetical protein
MFRSSRVSITFSLLATTAALSGQVPDGWGVASVFQQPKLAPGGITVFHPYKKNVSWAVSGLPVDLTGVGSGSTSSHGANAILVHPMDGRLIVGERTTITNDILEIHEILLVGRKAKSLKRHRIGKRHVSKVSNVAAVKQMVWLPDGRVLFAHTGHDNKSLAGSDLATLDLKTGTIKAIPVTGTPAYATHLVNALTVDPAGKTAYIGYATRRGRFPRRTLSIYSVPVASGGKATLVASYLDQVVMQLAVDNDGSLLVATNRTPGLLRFRASKWSVVSSMPSGLNAMEVDRVTGNYLCMAVSGGRVVLYRVRPNGARTEVLTYPAGSSQLTGIAVKASMDTYGTEMPGSYRWSTTPNPGGAPSLGNTGFSLTARATSRTSTGVLGLGLAPTNLVLPAFRLLVDRIVLILPLPAAATVSLPLPVPSNSAFVGIRVYAQTVHGGGAALASSRGLRFALL